MEEYDHKEIEPKWQKKWDETEAHKTENGKSNQENFHLLVEFPYPSGDLHVGHWYAFSVPDILARYKRTRGFNVLYPIGFDAFGLPAENAAIKRKLNPRTWTEGNIESMTKQIKSIGASFDWSRMVSTIDPSYYKWTQWQFLQFFKNNLAYQKETPANWCPSCKTVLANEQVINGFCERCDSEVEKKNMLQWNLKITDYADRLVDDLEPLDWPEEIKQSQRNWIGRSEGVEIEFQLVAGNPGFASEASPDPTPQKQNTGLPAVPVFTTRPDTLFGATYLVLAPEHELVSQLKEQIENNDEIEKYVQTAAKRSDIERTAEGKEKTGVKLEGVTAINPANGEEIPVFIADYVLAHYGTGAIMAVPAHDERDHAFAQKFDLPVRQVIAPRLIQTTEPGAFLHGEETVTRDGIIVLLKHWEEEKYLALRWKEVAWVTLLTGGIESSEDPKETVLREIKEETGYQNAEIAEDLGVVDGLFYHVPKKENRLVHGHMFLAQLKDNEQKAISEEEAARHDSVWLTLEEMKEQLTAPTHQHTIEWFQNSDKTYTGAGTLINSSTFSELESTEAKDAITKHVGGEIRNTYKLRDWGVSRQRYWGVPIPIIHCSKCGPVAVPDDQLPVELPEIEDYLPRDDGKSPLAKAEKWMKVPCPSCGEEGERETDTLDTFVDSSWYFIRYADPNNANEFASKDAQSAWLPVPFYSGGAEHTTMHVLYSRFWYKALHDLGFVADSEPYTRRMNRGIILGPDGNKMSKSKGNVINPDEFVERLGADSVRMYLAFIGPYATVGAYPWSTDGIVGVRRFLERVWRMQFNTTDNTSPDVEKALHRLVKKVGEDIELLKFNTAIAAMMQFVNLAEKEGITKEQFTTLVRVLAPFAPHMSEELWEILEHSDSIHKQNWPTYDKAQLVDDEITIVAQVNGKVRAEVTVPKDVDELSAIAVAEEALTKWLDGKESKRAIYVPGRLVNFVVAKDK